MNYFFFNFVDNRPKDFVDCTHRRTTQEEFKETLQLSRIARSSGRHPRLIFLSVDRYFVRVCLSLNHAQKLPFPLPSRNGCKSNDEPAFCPDFNERFAWRREAPGGKMKSWSFKPKPRDGNQRIPPLGVSLGETLSSKRAESTIPCSLTCLVASKALSRYFRQRC